MTEVTIQRGMLKLKEVDLFYLDTQSAGPAILCLHGRWGRGETWLPFMRRYGKTYRVVAPDLRGHGKSGKPVARYTADEMAADCIELLDALGIERCIVIGHSMGGRVAGYLPAFYPERIVASAILDRSAAGQATYPLPELMDVDAVDPLTNSWPLPFASRQEAQAFISRIAESPLSLQYYLNSLQETADGYRMMFSAQAMAAGIAYDVNWFTLLPKIKCPTLLLRAQGQDGVNDEDFAKMQALLPDCHARQMSLPDHNVHLSDEEEFYGYLDSFLTEARICLQ